LEGISDSNCSKLAHNFYTLLTKFCIKRVCQFILKAEFSTVENWRFVFVFLQANKQPSTHPHFCGVAETIYVKYNLWINISHDYWNTNSPCLVWFVVSPQCVPYLTAWGNSLWSFIKSEGDTGIMWRHLQDVHKVYSSGVAESIVTQCQEEPM
jgi:hypothetical protein